MANTKKKKPSSRLHKYKRFHVTLSDAIGKKRRTTISVEDYIADAMAIYLKTEPNSKEASAAIGIWLQHEIDSGLEDSFELKKKMFFDLIEEKIFKEYSAYKDQMFKKFGR